MLLLQALVVDEMAPEIAARLQIPMIIDRVRLTPEGEAAPEERDVFSGFIVPYVVNILLVMSIFMPSGFLIQSVTEEKQTRTIEMLLSSVSPVTLMAGKILGLGTAGLFQVLLWLATARVLASVARALLPLPSAISIEPAMLGLGALFFLLGYLFFATILAGIGALATSPQEGSQLSALVTLPAMVPLFLLSVIINEPSGVLARVFTFIPITFPITVMLRLSAINLPWLDIAMAVLLLALSTVGAHLLAAKVFRTYLFLHARRPALREIWRTLGAAASGEWEVGTAI